MKHAAIAPGVLYAFRGRPNPAGAASELYLLAGAPAMSPIREIIVEPGLTLPGQPRLPSGQRCCLRLLHFNDLHGRLADVSRDAVSPVFSRMAGYIRRVRAACNTRCDAGVLSFSGGDDLMGSAFAELAGCRPANFRCHPVYRLYSVAGVDAAAVGNHDVDWGLGMLARAARQDAAFPLLSSNLLPASESAGIYPAALFVVGTVRVGVIGLTTPSEIKHVIPGEFTIGDPVAAVRNLLPILRPLCDVLIVLSHLGYSLADPSAMVAVAGDVEVAAALPAGSVDLIVGAHTHQTADLVSHASEPGISVVDRVNGIPIVHAGAHGRFLGEVTVDVTRDGAAVTGARLHRVVELEGDAGFETAHVYPLAREVQQILREPLGSVVQHGDIDPAQVRDAWAAGESALANFVADALAARCRAAGFPVAFAMVDASSVCAGLPQGSLTFEDVFRMAPHADSLVLRRLAFAQVQALLDDNARRLDRPGDGREERGFVHFSREVRYKIAGGLLRSEMHAVDATINGAPFVALAAASAPDAPTRSLLVASSSFLRELAAGWERKIASKGLAILDLHALPVEQTGLALREELVAYVREHGGVTPRNGLVRDARVALLATASTPKPEHSIQGDVK